ncbi:MAG TPA: endoflagellar protein [Clostridiaceae bacterium]|jgi:flagellar protein FlbD|nr:endoflagellar protein [Clostridiaceae bacterium]HBF76297.1 endoflagellar protein [Clostridiaceae bacterium]HBG39039.1 endoflagellar protein [Clostridiaceae bacterium]HBN27664.1 endoflagellar protein [Clostridiaceae bacterium]HBX49042.1 endoflagellar protein [Clostridiaceae bacterium]
MIKLTGLNNKALYLNPDLFEKLEVTPDTVITLSNGKKYVVKESPDEVIELIIQFRRKYMYYISEVIK